MSDIDVMHVGKCYRVTPGGAPRRLRRPSQLMRRKEKWVLRDIIFSVEPGQALAVIGKNGSGKSTLLRLLAGVTEPTTGRIRIRRKLNGLLTLGDVFHPMLTGEENALSSAIVAGLTKRQAVARLDDIASFSELEPYMDQPLRTYSDGMRLRLAFATAINVDPEILLIDEVLTVGDLRFQARCIQRVRELKAAGVTVVVASHHMEQLRALCDEAIWLADGCVRAHGSVDDVTANFERAVEEAAPERVPGPLGTKRLGTGEVEIVSVELLDTSGTPSSTLSQSAPATVVIDYIAHEEVAEPIFGVSAHSLIDGTRHFDFSTAADGESLGIIGATGTVRLHLERLDLIPGAYHLDVGIYERDWNHPYDYLWQAVYFDCISETTRLKGSPRTWSMG
jgi:lipopolysaccharide transport system ATP-binding protein